MHIANWFLAKVLRTYMAEMTVSSNGADKLDVHMWRKKTDQLN